LKKCIVIAFTSGLGRAADTSSGAGCTRALQPPLPGITRNKEPAHEHVDIRYLTATQAPHADRPESLNAPPRWLSVAEAHEATSESNLRETLARLERQLPR
jgi:hypothetical protein